MTRRNTHEDIPKAQTPDAYCYIRGLSPESILYPRFVPLPVVPLLKRLTTSGPQQFAYDYIVPESDYPERESGGGGPPNPLKKGRWAFTSATDDTRYVGYCAGRVIESFDGVS